MCTIKKFVIFTLLITLISSIKSNSQNFVQQTTGPLGIDAAQFLIDHFGRILLIDSYGNLYYSTNNGTVWNRTGSTIGLQGAHEIEVDSANDLWAATGDSVNVYSSTDLGATWTQRGSGIPSTSYVYTLFVHKSGMIFAATTTGLCQWSVQNNQWYLVGGGMPTVSVASIASYGDSILYVGTSKGSVYKSTNLGEVWGRCGTLPTPSIVQSIAVDNNGNVFATSPYGFNAKNPTDTSWTDISSEITGFLFGSIVHRDEKTGTLYVTCSQGLYKESSNGSSWTSLDGNGMRVAWINTVICPDTSTILAGTVGAGVYKTTDNGSSWIAVNQGLIASDIKGIAVSPDGEVFAGMWGAIYSSADSGKTWIDRSASLPNYLISSVFYTGQNAILAGTSGGIYRSTDKGNSWGSANSGMTATPATPIISNSLGTIFNGAQGGGVFRSTDDGVSWTPVNTGLTGVSVQTLVRDQKDNLFTAIGGGSIFKSTNSGDTWSLVKNLGINVSSLLVDTSGLVVAGTSFSGIYRSTDGGKTFNKIQNELGADGILALIANKAGYLFAGTSVGLYRSLDWGQTWTGTDSALVGIQINNLLLDANNYLYCGTAGAGVWRSVAPTLSYGLTTAYDAGKIHVKDSAVIRVQLYNPSAYPVAIRSVSLVKDSVFFILSAPTSIGAFDTNLVQVVFTPQRDGLQIDTLLIKTDLYQAAVSIQGTGVSGTGVKGPSSLPNEFSLDQNYPNPFNPTTVINYQLPVNTLVTLEVYDVLGREVRALVGERQTAGTHSVAFNAENLSSGIYFYRLTAGNYVDTKKLLLLK